MSVRLYIKDMRTGTVREYGTDQHDALTVDGSGFVRYENLQNGDGSPSGYRFVDKDGNEVDRCDYEYLDVGGDYFSCSGCKWHGTRHQKCSCCARNKHLKDNYKPTD